MTSAGKVALKVCSVVVLNLRRTSGYDLAAIPPSLLQTEPPPPPDTNGVEPPAGEAGAAGEAHQGGAAAVAVPEDLVPFADVGNPVMAQVGGWAAAWWHPRCKRFTLTMGH